MASRPKVNLRSTAVKRIMQEAAELASADVEDDGFAAAPLEDDIFEWHCTMRGVQGSEYEGGLYHLRILLPPTYPMSAPDIMLMTPNGRFELGKKICIDGLTSFHAGSWQPAWGVRTAVVGLRSFWMQNGEALSAIGALDYSKDERRRLAGLSKAWKCPSCGVRNDEIVPPSPPRIESQSSAPSDPGGTVPDLAEGHDEEGKTKATSSAESEGVIQPSSNGNDHGEISIEPCPAEIPTIVPPPSLASIGLHTNGGGSIAQSLPIEIIPPAMEAPAADESSRSRSALPSDGAAQDTRDESTSGPEVNSRRPQSLPTRTISHQSDVTHNLDVNDRTLSPTPTRTQPQTEVQAAPGQGQTATTAQVQEQNSGRIISPLPPPRNKAALLGLDVIIVSFLLILILLITQRMERI